MAKWINAKKRLPFKSGSYFVKTNGNKNIYSFHEFDAEKIDRYDSFFWLDEEIVESPVHENEIISALRKGESIDKFKVNLINFFGKMYRNKTTNAK